MRRFDLTHSDGRHFRLAKCAPLPWPYVQLEYIQSSGTQYIDTGFAPNTNSAMELTFQLTEVQSTIMAGSRSYDAKTNAFTINCGAGGTKFLAAFDGSNNVELANLDLNKHTTKIQKDTFVFDGEEISALTYNFTSNLDVLIFANRNGPGEINLYAKVKVYACKIWQSGTLVHNFIPCWNLKTKTAGLYDLMNQSFLGNSGTGYIFDGPEVNPFMQLAAANH